MAEAPKKVEAPPFEGKILDVAIDSESMAIVLDVSGSMLAYLPAIRKELRENAPKNPTLHVEGTGVERPSPQATIENGTAPETITAIDTLAKYTTATTMLWITDLADPPNVAGIRSLEKVLHDNGLRLFLISLQNKPPPSLQKVIISTEGDWKVIDAEKLR